MSRKRSDKSGTIVQSSGRRAAPLPASAERARWLVMVMGVFTLVTLLSACLGVPRGIPAGDSIGDPESLYVIGPEDVLAISVWREESLTTTVPVRPDGRISLPLAGELQAAGLTPRELEEEIAGRLGEYVMDLPVTVVVAEINHQRIYVLGEVTRPGEYPVRSRRIGLLQGLAVAGGLTDFADGSRILVIRTLPDGSQRRYRIDYRALVSDRGRDFVLYPGDTVVVP